MTAFSKKTIDSHIRNRIKYWIYDFGRNAHTYLQKELELSTDDKEKLTEEDKNKIGQFQRNVRDATIVTGGCFTSMLQGELPNDIDIYFNNMDVAKLVSWYYINQMRTTGELKETTYSPLIDIQTMDGGVTILIKSQGITGDGIKSEDYRYFEMHPENDIDQFFKEYRNKVKDVGTSYNVSFMTSNAITLANNLQIITRFVGSIDEIHANFDFIHTTNFWTWECGVVYSERALAATLEKRLYYFGSRFPVATIFRMRKFIERGWRISGGEMLKVAFDVSKLDLTNVNVLRDQSIGMDSAYFHEVIEKIHDKKDIDRTYLFQCIDEVFQLSDKQENFLERYTEDVPEDNSITSEMVDLN